MLALNQLLVLAQDNSGAEAAGAAAAGMILLVQLGIVVLMIAGMWAAFAKAGKPGWAAIIPIYNGMVMLEIGGKPIWWILLFLIPLVNIIVAIMATSAFAKAYGKGAGFTLGLIFLPFIFYPMLGFGSAKYVGASA